jgi:uncharacterized coiled-coil DUF342 family protein
MLNELETLSRNIGRLVALNQRHHAETLRLEELLAQQRTEAEALRAELSQLRGERDALASERNTLSAKIDDAQVKLNAILEKLPHSRGGDADAQLDLLEPSDNGEPSQGEHA